MLSALSAQMKRACTGLKEGFKDGFCDGFQGFAEDVSRKGFLGEGASGGGSRQGRSYIHSRFELDALQCRYAILYLPTIPYGNMPYARMSWAICHMTICLYTHIYAHGNYNNITEYGHEAKPSIL